MDLNKWLNDILSNKDINICILGDTLQADKYAYKIKHALLDRGYHNLFCVDKEISSLNDVPSTIDLTILCMNPNKAINLLSASNNKMLNVLIQPGANSEAITQWLNEHKTTYLDGCILAHFSIYDK